MRVPVYRSGLLGGFGHNHVISHGNIIGSVKLAQDVPLSSLSLGLALADLVIDDPALRQLLGPDFAGKVSDKDRTGTRVNLFGEKLLQAEQFPDIQASSNRIRGSLPHLEIEATVIVRGQENVLLFPAVLEISDNSLVASGKIEIRHADIGLVPFKAFLSTIKVRDKIELQYFVQADRDVVQPD